MLQKSKISFYLKYAVLAAILYSLVLLWYIKAASFEATYILYIANVAFGIGILIFSIMDKIPQEARNKAAKKVIAGHVVTVAAILISCLIALLLFAIMMPDVFNTADATRTVLEDKPAQMENNHQGLMFSVFMNAIVGNISTGSFISILFAFVLVDKKVNR